ncbi:ABC transporter substrate-binding protein [Achromobacter aloeverae]|uniref:ABC transporter substrate-binding protein n=1 Tax=Achromobacter aloeverae TaxID=1750518 RepID=A0A4V1MSJ5_9BURK|nr:ABC transporter substrate-binding protein [Achromobacter aloeverae]RXN92260.1 ABC transporter substrate-binding protein [Achromobacter aloeverae]
MTKSRYSLFAAAARWSLAALALGGALSASALADEAPVHGGVLQAIVQPEPPVLTTAFNTSFPIGTVGTNILEGLLAFDDKQQLQPALATSWETSPDGKTVTFHLRPGVKWHDGRPFTSADVRFSALEVWKKLHPRGRSTFAALDDVETPDPLTAVFKLRHPSLVIFSSLNANEAQILPRHLYEGTDILTNPYNLKPVGTGPFRFKEWKKGQYIELERNPDYWDKGKPYLDKIVFRVIPDPASRAVALETGDVQYAPFDAVPYADVSRLRALPGLVVKTDGYAWQSAYVFLEFNLRNPILKDVRVRRAIDQAIDKQALIDTVWYGLGKPAVSPIPSSLTAFHTSEGVPQYPYDPKAAERLLDEAGYPRKAGGMRFTLNQEYQNFHETFKNNAEYIRQALRRVGIDVKVNNRDIAGHLKAVYGAYDFDINTGRWVPSLDPQIGGLRHYSSKAISQGTPWSNASGYSSPEMDALIAAIQVEADAAKRVELFHQFQRLAQQDLPVIPLFEQENFTVASKRVQGLSSAPDAALASLKNVWLRPE